MIALCTDVKIHLEPINDPRTGAKLLNEFSDAKAILCNQTIEC